MSESRNLNRLLFASLALCACVLFSPDRAEAQFHITTELHTGIPVPFGADVDWGAGYEVGGGFGFAIRGDDFLIGATVIEVNYASFHGDNKPYSRFDIMMLCPQILFVLKPILIGVRLSAGLRITEDGHHPTAVTPDGEEVTNYINFGLDVGPRIWWPINEYFALDASLEYQLSSNEIPDDFVDDPRGSPRHGMVFRLGLVFAP